MQVFFIKDGIMFPDLVHSLRPNPKTHIQEGWRILDFLGNYPESTLMVCPALPLLCNSPVLYIKPCFCPHVYTILPSVLMYVHTLLLPCCIHLPSCRVHMPLLCSSPVLHTKLCSCPWSLSPP